MQSQARKKAFAIAREVLADPALPPKERDEQVKEDRMMLAEQILVLPETPTSWDELDDDQICRILDAFAGYHFISHLLANR